MQGFPGRGGPECWSRREGRAGIVHSFSWIKSHDSKIKAENL